MAGKNAGRGEDVFFLSFAAPPQALGARLLPVLKVLAPLWRLSS